MRGPEPLNMCKEGEDIPSTARAFTPSAYEIPPRMKAARASAARLVVEEFANGPQRLFGLGAGDAAKLKAIPAAELQNGGVVWRERLAATADIKVQQKRERKFLPPDVHQGPSLDFYSATLFVEYA